MRRFRPGFKLVACLIVVAQMAIVALQRAQIGSQQVLLDEIKSHPSGPVHSIMGAAPKTSLVIPLTLFFTYKLNILDGKTLPPGAASWDPKSKQALAWPTTANVINVMSEKDCSSGTEKIMNMEGNERVHLKVLDESTCIDILGSLPPKLSRPLRKAFTDETRSWFRADICKGAAVYAQGGFYAGTLAAACFFSSDLQTTAAAAFFRSDPLAAQIQTWALGCHFETLCLKGLPSWQQGPRVMSPVRSQSTPDSRLLSGHMSQFFQGFFGATKQHPALYKYLQRLKEFYSKEQQAKHVSKRLACKRPELAGGKPYQDGRTHDHSCNLLPRLLYQAWEDWQLDHVGMLSGFHFRTVDAQLRQHPATAMIMQEDWKQSVPPVNRAIASQHGLGCCCDEVIWDPVTLKVPFYSRSPGTGSWFCVDIEKMPSLPEDNPALCQEMLKYHKVDPCFCERKCLNGNPGYKPMYKSVIKNKVV